MTLSEAREELKRLEMEEFAYGYAMGSLHYDGETGAPRDTYIPRGKALGILSGVGYQLATGERSERLLDALSEHMDELTSAERRTVELRQKDLRELKSIPMDEYVAYRELLNESHIVWTEAKERDDFASFEPVLHKIIDANRRFAALAAPDTDPYDYCLDKYEEGLTMERCDRFFGVLRDKLVPLIEKVKRAEAPDTSLLGVDFPLDRQEKLSYKLMDLLGLDRSRCRLGTTEHPFTLDLSKYDVRITTHYYENAFASSMFSVIHEGGHALYELHTADEYAYTGLGGGVSMAVHESQSRFFENIIARSRPFCEHIWPTLVELCPELGKYSAKDFYRAVNTSKPSLIRIEADELTYSLHIMVRYELERAFMHGELEARDLPSAWKELYSKYLGVEVPDDRSGVLQDSHWSGGQIGYFPSYALGSAYGAQIVAKMKETVDVDECVAAGDLSPVCAWLEERIWRHGRLYKPTELIENAMGAPFDPKFYTDYLEAKMAAVYRF